MALSEEAISVLKLRSVADKFALDFESFLTSEGFCELLDNDMCHYLDTAVLYGKVCLVYKLTPKGIAYCDANGIEQH